MKTLTVDELEDIKARAIALCDEPLADLDLDGDLDLDLSAIEPTRIDKLTAPVTTPAPARPSRRAMKISIRIPARTLAAFRAQATKKGVGYQTLIVQTLRAAAASWERAPL